MKVLNLYAGIGGNRKLWDNAEVTAIEWDKQRAKIYQTFYPADTVLIEDAHEYLLQYFDEYDFIWSSPPCPTHSVLAIGNNAQKRRVYPDMQLWQEITYLQTFHKGKWVVENVRPYYTLLPFQWVARHAFWSNFPITPFLYNPQFNLTNSRQTTRMKPREWLTHLECYHGITLKQFNLPLYKQQELLVDCVNPKLGLHVYKCGTEGRQKILEMY